MKDKKESSDNEELKQLIREMMEEKEEGGKDKEPKEQDVKKVESSVDLDGLADVIVKAVQKSAGGTSEQADHFVRQNLYNDKEGLKGVAYPDIKTLDNCSDEEKIVLYVKTLFEMRNSPEAYAINKFLSEGVAADGGNLVPAPLAAAVFRLLPDVAIMRKLARIMPMTSQTLLLPTNTTDPEAYFIGENKTKTTTSAEFGQVTLTAYKLVCRLPITHELIQDAVIDIVNWIIERFAEAIAEREDRAFFTGSGVAQPTGVATAAGIGNTAVGGTFDFDDVITLMNSVRQSVRLGAGTAFVGHNTVIQKLERVKDTNGQYIWRQGGSIGDGQIQRLPGTIYGYPVYEQNDLSQDQLWFGDWKKGYVIGDRQTLTVATTDEGGDAWIRDHTDVKAVERIAGNVVLPGAFHYLAGIMT